MRTGSKLKIVGHGFRLGCSWAFDFQVEKSSNLELRVGKLGPRMQEIRKIALSKRPLHADASAAVDISISK